MHYIRKIREKLGKQKFIHPGARVIVQNDRKEVLFIRRKDSGQLGLPAGGLEENETIEECIIRECREETGIEIKDLVVVGISSNPKAETVVYPNGDVIQYFTIEFYSQHWTGHLQVDPEETVEVFFADEKLQNDLPVNEQSAFKSLEYYRRNGKIRVH